MELLDFDVDEDGELEQIDHTSKLKTQSRDVLRLHLHHGDIVIQQGAELQELYEVEPI